MDRGSKKGTPPGPAPSHLYFHRRHLHNMQLKYYYLPAQKTSVVSDMHAQLFRETRNGLMEI